MIAWICNLPWQVARSRFFTLGSSSTDCAPFKTRSLRFEWETTILTLPLIAKNAMNGAQLPMIYGDSLRRMIGPPANENDDESEGQEEQQ